MNKFFVVGLLWVSLFLAACGGSSDKSTSDPCTEDPNLPECLTNTEEEQPQQEEKPTSIEP